MPKLPPVRSHQSDPDEIDNEIKAEFAYSEFQQLFEEKLISLAIDTGENPLVLTHEQEVIDDPKTIIRFRIEVFAEAIENTRVKH